MKIDYEYLRKELLTIQKEIESNDSPTLEYVFAELSESDDPEDLKKYFHISKMVELGYLNGDSISYSTITSDGYKFLDLTKDNACWEKVKSLLYSMGETALNTSLQNILSQLTELL